MISAVDENIDPSSSVSIPDNNNNVNNNMEEGRTIVSRKATTTTNHLHHQHDHLESATAATAAAAAQSPEELVRTETKFVQYFRTATIALLIAEAVTAGLIIYRQATNQESQAFQKDFETVSSLIVQGVVDRLDRLLWESYSFSVAIQGIVAASGQSTPNITIPMFQELSVNPIESNQVERVVWSPYIADKQQRLEFEEYVTSMEKSNATTTFREIATNHQAVFVLGANNNNDNSVSTTAGPNFPVWQVAPTTNTSEHAILFDMYSDPIRQAALQQMMNARLPALSEAFNASQSLYHVMDGTMNETNVLRTALYHPVVGNRDNLLGCINFDVIWEKLLESVLPPKSKDLIIVLQNTHGQTFSFGTKQHGNGSMVVNLLDDTDVHHPQYSRMGQESSYQLFDSFRSRFTNGISSPTTQDLGSYRVLVYPTEVYETQFVNGSVLSYTLAPVVFLFIFTTMMFLLYDCIVKRRQIKVMASAQASGAIVSSLFPAAVRDRLMAKAQHDQEISGEFSSVVVEPPRDEARSTFLPRLMETPKLRLKNFLKSNPASSGPSMAITYDEEPIADLFHNTTVMFADIAGFTAWSSEREPPQVFKLLETLYSAFDQVANSLGVFKVETIGDCYVAVTGLPEPQADHAVRMAQFASAIIRKMQDLTKVLESSLGPSTANLSVRVGLHSGPVTAGVLRGQKARFQLFGDTINTASRMESTGQVNKIQISHVTADLLAEAGFGKWVTPRQELLSVKGKGDMQTYWINSSIAKTSSPLSSTTIAISPRGAMQRSSSSVSSGCNDSARSEGPAEQSEAADESIDTWGKLTFHDTSLFQAAGKTRLDRLVDWNTDLLFNYLTQIVVKRHGAEENLSPRRGGRRHRRMASSTSCKTDPKTSSSTTSSKRYEIKGRVAREFELHVGSTGYPIDEITDAVTMPTTTTKAAAKAITTTTSSNSSSYNHNSNVKEIIDMSSVRTQLRHYVARIATMYRSSNPFHGFEHASHVVMSACKLLKRIVRPEDINVFQFDNPNKQGGGDHMAAALSQAIHESTYGISSDPLLQFAVVFAALIHDVDHCGVPNAQLVKDRHEMAIKFNNRSVAEQHSLQLAWNTLMDDMYGDLRACIYASDEQELLRFRQLLVNAVLATDIADQTQLSIRKRRWEKAFHHQHHHHSSAATTNSDDQTQMSVLTDDDIDDTVVARGGGGVVDAVGGGVDYDMERKASLVLEYVIQASDVAHTMQHWHVFLKWNERLFEERYLAYVEGRCSQDPSLCWYHDEIWFFDSYIIPLAKKLSECGVFGVSSQEYLTYALENRREWEEKGRAWVVQMVGAQAKAA